jgi:hypothetical protein
MSSDTIWQRLRRTPFTAFRLRVSDGKYYDILHPEMVGLTKQSVNIFVYDRGAKPGQDIPARQVIISPLHVTSVEDIPTRRRTSA